MIHFLPVFLVPIPSMYGIFTYIYHKNQLNVGRYAIHGSYGVYRTQTTVSKRPNENYFITLCLVLLKTIWFHHHFAIHRSEARNYFRKMLNVEALVPMNTYRSMVVNKSPLLRSLVYMGGISRGWSMLNGKIGTPFGPTDPEEKTYAWLDFHIYGVLIIPRKIQGVVLPNNPSRLWPKQPWPVVPPFSLINALFLLHVFFLGDQKIPQPLLRKKTSQVQVNEVIFNTAIDIQGKGVAFQTKTVGLWNLQRWWWKEFDALGKPKKKRHSESVRWRFG